MTGDGYDHVVASRADDDATAAGDACKCANVDGAPRRGARSRGRQQKRICETVKDFFKDPPEESTWKFMHLALQLFKEEVLFGLSNFTTTFFKFSV